MARGLMSEVDLAAVHDRMQADLARVGVALDGVYTCVREVGECDRRTSGIGLFMPALREHPDHPRAWGAGMGDAISDLETAARLEIDAYAIVPDAERDALDAQVRGRRLPIVGTPDSLASLLRHGLGISVA